MTGKFFAAIVFAAASVLPGAAVDLESFKNPPKDNYPETWFHFISGNVSEDGITADLEAIAAAGFSGVQLFHGHFNDNVWPGVTDPIKCLAPNWEHAVRHTDMDSRHGARIRLRHGL